MWRLICNPPGYHSFSVVTHNIVALLHWSHEHYSDNYVHCSVFTQVYKMAVFCSKHSHGERHDNDIETWANNHQYL